MQAEGTNGCALTIGRFHPICRATWNGIGSLFQAIMPPCDAAIAVIRVSIRLALGPDSAEATTTVAEEDE